MSTDIPDVTDPGADEAQREMQMLRAHDREMRELAKEIDRLETEHAHAKDVASAKKKELEATYRNLAELARDRPSIGPLFDGGGDDEDAPGQQTFGGDWRDQSISTLREYGLRDWVCELLACAGIRTVGDLDAKVEHGTEWWADITRIDAPAAAAITGALNKFDAARRQAEAEVQEAE